jgi:hypothetical protein
MRGFCFVLQSCLSNSKMHHSFLGFALTQSNFAHDRKYELQNLLSNHELHLFCFVNFIKMKPYHFQCSFLKPVDKIWYKILQTLTEWHHSYANFFSVAFKTLANSDENQFIRLIQNQITKLTCIIVSWAHGELSTNALGNY